MKVRVKNVEENNTPSNWFEIGKVYRAEKLNRHKFLIKHPSAYLVGGKWTCRLNGCAHLGGGDWEIVKEDNFFVRIWNKSVSLFK